MLSKYSYSYSGFVYSPQPWKTHISYLAGKIARVIGVLRKARKNSNNDCMINLYNAFIYPYLMYCNQIWGSINLSKLQVLQNKAVRIVTGSPPRSNSENIYRCSGIMKLNYINTYLMGRFMYRIYQKTLSAILMTFSDTIIKYMIMIPGLRAI